MSRARDKDEQELLRKARSERKSSGGSAVCSSPNCPEFGMAQPLSNFYFSKGRRDGYCIMCKRARSRQWWLDHPDYVRGSGTPKTKWELKLEKAPMCKDHGIPSNKCGCATSSMFHKSPTHRARLAEAARAAWARRKGSGQ